MRKLTITARFSFALALAASVTAFADDKARFDLIGPRIDVRVTRNGNTLPFAQVPNLEIGDKIWVHPDFPPTQSVHLLVIVTFLRGATNPPPDSWFTKIETWDKKVKAEGVTVTVPAEAQQALIFVAPETGGDFSTLKSAVKGRPGLFVRASSDLNEASFEQSRIEQYLEAMKNVPSSDQKAIQDHSQKLASTLALKPNADCFKQPVEQQVNCLTQTGGQLLLDDGHGQSIAAALSNGASSDFINAASTTQMAGAGVYSAYVGAIVDLVRLTSLLRTAQYQYIPAIESPKEQTLNLRLNAPPSFHNPKSVIVVGLPAIQKAVLPPLRPHDANEVACLLQPKMVLGLEGAPLVFATGFAHDLVLHLNRTGAATDLPLKPDAYEGGLVIDKNPSQRKPLSAVDVPQAKSDEPAPSIASSTDMTVTGTVRGYWGFDSFTGPTLQLQQINGKDWKLIGNTQFYAGQDNHVALTSTGTACVQDIELTNSKGRDVKVDFKPKEGSDDASVKNQLDLTVKMQKVDPGGYSLRIQQYGSKEQTQVSVTAYNSGVHLAALKIHAGDSSAVLTGDALSLVQSAQIADQEFTPASGSDAKTVNLNAKSGVIPQEGATAQVKLKDGRTLTVPVTLEAARPGVKLLAVNVEPTQDSGSLPIQLGSKNDLPLNGRIVFVVQTEKSFPRDQKLEVQTADGSLHTNLSLADNSLILQDEHTAVATLDPQKAFGASAFGKLSVRPIAADGTSGAWADLGMLVRTPQISAVKCDDGAKTCSITGNNLFLLNGVSPTSDGNNAQPLPVGFAQNSLTVPAPADGATLYLKLRDDPGTIASVKIPGATPKTQPAPATDSPAATAPAAPPSPAPATDAGAATH